MPTPDQEINPDQPTPLRGALAVASLGLPVVPLHHPTKTTAGIEHARCSCGKYPCGPGNRNVGKHPCIGEGWQTKASTDPDQIRRWATEYPGCNFGYVLGDEFIGFDGDGRNGLDRGERELADQGHRFSDTLTVQTGDGWHRVYATDGIKFSSLRLATGIDGRTGNMILVAPDSLHWSGVRYILTSDAPIAPVDFWLWERLGIKGDDQEYPDGTEDGPPRHEKPPVGAEELVAKYEQVRPAIRSLFETEPPEGKWSDALWRLALELADAGADRDERMAVLKAAACNKSGRDGKGDRWLWRHYVVKAEEKQSQTDEKVLQQELKRLRVRDRARELLRAEKEADRYREPPPSRSLEHELADRPEPSRWAIPDWAPDEGNIGIEAKKKTGKTTLMGNVTKCLVDHLPFLGNEQWIPRELDGNVGYCNLELPDWQFLDWLEDMEIKNASRVIPWHLRGRRMPMNVDLVVERYIDWLTDHDIEVWILDPRNRAWKGIVTDENNNSQ